MAKHSNGIGRTPTPKNLSGKVDAVYASGDRAMIDQMTRLLVLALSNKNERSLSALNHFFGLPVIKQDSEIAQCDTGLVQRARLFIDGKNAHRVETWILNYERSEPDSKRRLFHEDILRNFVSS